MLELFSHLIPWVRYKYPPLSNIVYLPTAVTKDLLEYLELMNSTSRFTFVEAPYHTSYRANGRFDTHRIHSLHIRDTKHTENSCHIKVFIPRHSNLTIRLEAYLRIYDVDITGKPMF